jgi:ATP-dependent helicase HrpB
VNEPNLPILGHRDTLVSTLIKERRMIVSAPPGSGKSTCVPRFFLDIPEFNQGKIIVLQPRRIAARSLAAYCSRLIGESCGETIGYQVRFDTKTSARTRVIFQTYGVFVRQLLSNPAAKGISIVVLDEFHERTLEMDLALAWINHLSKSNSHALAFIVMSATLDGDALSKFLDSAPVVDVPARMYPVDISYQQPKPFETVQQQATRATQAACSSSVDGSVLVFMPGLGEIKSTISQLDDFCARKSIGLYHLHGSMSLGDQIQVLDEAQKRTCVIVSTNVAETSLTIPGVTAVIDSGLERRAAFDPDRDRNTLYRCRISKHSATQRAGRAGRTAPGQCIRLWTKSDEQAMPESITPEITRLELSAIALITLGLMHRSGHTITNSQVLDWLTPPDQDRWNHAIDLLKDLGAVDASGLSLRLTELGDRILESPADPLPSAILIESNRHNVALISCAIIALWESEERSKNNEPMNLFESAMSLIIDKRSRQFSNDTRQSFESLSASIPSIQYKKEFAVLESAEKSKNVDEHDKLTKQVVQCWMKPLKKRLAIQDEDGQRYLLMSDKSAIIRKSHAKQELPGAVIALTILETAGSAQSRKSVINQILPVNPGWILESFKNQLTEKALCRWDDQKQAVIAEKLILLDGLAVVRESITNDKTTREQAGDILAEKLSDGTIAIIDDAIRQLLFRIQAVAKVHPDYGFPSMNSDDWQLIYHEYAKNKTSRKQLEESSLEQAIIEYIGASLVSALDRLAPIRIKLPSGKMGKVAYFENAPPELSARIGDFIGMKGKFIICEGRIQGIFDILAPNYRTVQKTADLTGFWQNSYPEIKNELKRRYPRHPWP